MVGKDKVVVPIKWSFPPSDSWIIGMWTPEEAGDERMKTLEIWPHNLIQSNKVNVGRWMKESENLCNCQSLMSSASIGGRDSLWKYLGMLLKIMSTVPKKSEQRCFKTAKKSQGSIVSHSDLNYSYEGEADFWLENDVCILG